MADVAVHRGWIEQGGLPPICLRTGGPTAGNEWRRKVSIAPAWTFLLIPAGVLIFAIVRMAISITLTTKLPMRRGLRLRHALCAYGGLLVVIAGIVGAIVGLSATSTIGAIAGALVVVLGCVVMGLGSRTFLVGIKRGEWPDYFVLTRVHPIAAAALDQHMRQATVAAPLPPPTWYR